MSRGNFCALKESGTRFRFLALKPEPEANGPSSSPLGPFHSGPDDPQTFINVMKREDLRSLTQTSLRFVTWYCPQNDSPLRRKPEPCDFGTAIVSNQQLGFQSQFETGRRRDHPVR